MKKFFKALLYACMVPVIFSACEDDNNPIPAPKVKIVSTDGSFAVAQEDTLILKAQLDNPLQTTLSWTLNGEEVFTDSIYKFVASEIGNFQIGLTALNEGGETKANASIEVYGKYKYGTFVLSEGAMGKEPGSIDFISPKGKVTNNAYELENGETLGSISQDIFIKNHKMYIVSQNGGDFITVVNAETLKKEKGFQDELTGKVYAPTHIAILDENDIYLRDNNGVKRFNPSTGEVTFIEGTKGARKNTMAVAKGKVFASVKNTVVVIEKGEDAITNTIEFEGEVSGVIKSSDDNLWVSDRNGKIYKVNTETCNISDSQMVSEEAKSALTWSPFAPPSTPSITAKGDTLYMSGLQSKIYRHIFSTGETKLMVDAKDMVENVGIVYNTVAVNPLTGEVIFNSIKGYGQDYKINNISVFDFSGEEAVLKANHENYTAFPAGTFFTYNFE